MKITADRFPEEKRRRYAGETYYRLAGSNVAWATDDKVASTSEDAVEEIRLTASANILREGDEHFDPRASIDALIERAIELGFDGVRIGDRLALLNPAAVITAQQKRRPGWTGLGLRDRLKNLVAPSDAPNSDATNSDAAPHWQDVGEEQVPTWAMGEKGVKWSLGDPARVWSEDPSQVHGAVAKLDSKGKPITPVTLPYGTEGKIVGVGPDYIVFQPNGGGKGVQLPKSSVMPDRPEAERKWASDDPPKEVLPWRGLDIAIEVYGGERRHPNGKFPTDVPRDIHGYGYFVGLPACDGDSLDVVLGRNESDLAFIADQLRDGEYHQSKVMLGFPDVIAAERAFAGMWPEEMFGGIKEVGIAELLEEVIPELTAARHERSGARVTTEQYAAVVHKAVGAKLLGEIDGVTVYRVDGEWIRDHIDVDFVSGGHDVRYAYIPGSTVWVEADMSDRDATAAIVHELTERDSMECGCDYNDAHSIAVQVERAFRAKWDGDGAPFRAAITFLEDFVPVDLRAPDPAELTRLGSADVKLKLSRSGYQRYKGKFEDADGTSHRVWVGGEHKIEPGSYGGGKRQRRRTVWLIKVDGDEIGEEDSLSSAKALAERHLGIAPSEDEALTDIIDDQGEPEIVEVSGPVMDDIAPAQNADVGFPGEHFVDVPNDSSPDLARRGLDLDQHSSHAGHDARADARNRRGRSHLDARRHHGMSRAVSGNVSGRNRSAESRTLDITVGDGTNEDCEEDLRSCSDTVRGNDRDLHPGARSRNAGTRPRGRAGNDAGLHISVSASPRGQLRREGKLVQLQRRAELVRYLEANGAEFLRDGAKHSIYVAGNGEMVPIPRHRDITPPTTEKILKKAGLYTFAKRQGVSDRSAAMPAQPEWHDVPAEEEEREETPVGKLRLKPNDGFRNIMKVIKLATGAEREYWGKWYHFAASVIQEVAGRYQLPAETVAGVVAVLSPGNTWHNNVNAAKKLIGWWKGQQEHGPFSTPALSGVDGPQAPSSDESTNELEHAAMRGRVAQLAPELVEKYEREWKEPRSLEKMLEEVEFLIRTRGPSPDLRELQSMLRMKLQNRAAQLGKPYNFEPATKQPADAPATVMKERKGPKERPTGYFGPPISTNNPRNVDKALAILNGATPESAISGPKVSVFYQSLLDPEGVQRELVLDGHAMNIWRGEKVPLKGITMPNQTERARMEADYEKAAAASGMSVQAVQALTWYIWKTVGGEES